MSSNRSIIMLCKESCLEVDLNLLLYKMIKKKFECEIWKCNNERYEKYLLRFYPFAFHSIRQVELRQLLFEWCGYYRNTIILTVIIHIVDDCIQYCVRSSTMIVTHEWKISQKVRNK